MKEKKDKTPKKAKDPITAKILSQLETPTPIEVLPSGNLQVAK
jgi:hypothetical protein